ncbi:phosphonate metabolism protein/1,5-bisphosphokinase (PRPP-forming) PhnN [Loktanella sp. S4079]|uniref:phosphonate metabolism protein/1,5-bisphosphokinase (PRPP-forming) PhnN n=1 Tax=Loktanella sp. S4079 TaxID=579483 RepID=UPI0005F9DD3D|nr:phosphonate metabolism protein/1,5-bisphosphokinase (PRPP-forming) PhnN [Loktanella sp. S4079]KJZ18841.1 ribose-phosphate pyrophosphokinase [Loktanella sp. S4079]
MAGRFIAVVGPSGVGKDTVMEAMAARDRRIKLAKRVITRPEDAGGEDFNGVTRAEFAAMREGGAFVLSWEAHGLAYGIPRAVIQDMSDGKDVLANLSRAQLSVTQSLFPRLEVLSLTATEEVLCARLIARGREPRAQVQARLDRVSCPIPEGIKKHVIDNSGALDAAVSAALAALYPERS